MSSARELLRSTEQSTLLNAATAYMNLLQTAAILELQRSNVNVLEVTLRQTRDRFTAGEVTRTDVAQAESRLAAGRSQLSLAESNYVTAQAQYQQVIGVPAPARLAPAAPVDRLSPRTLDGAIARGRTEHPLITTATYNVDIAVQQVKIAEGALYPTLSAVGSVQKTFGSASALAVLETLSASVGAQLSVPIYQGGVGILHHPASQGDAGTASSGSRHRARSGAVDGDPGLGSARGRQGADQRDPGASDCRRSGAQWRARGSPRGATYDTRRPQRAAGSGECTRGARHSATRSRGGVLYRAGGDRCAFAASPRAENRGVRPRRCITSRCATSGVACARPTAADPAVAGSRLRRSALHLGNSLFASNVRHAILVLLQRFGTMPILFDPPRGSNRGRSEWGRKP